MSGGKKVLKDASCLDEGWGETFSPAMDLAIWGAGVYKNGVSVLTLSGLGLTIASSVKNWWYEGKESHAVKVGFELAGIGLAISGAVAMGGIVGVAYAVMIPLDFDIISVVQTLTDDVWDGNFAQYGVTAENMGLIQVENHD